MRVADRARPGVAALVAGTLALGWCVGVGATPRMDPMFALEFAGAGVLLLWTTFMGRDVWQAARLRGRLDRNSWPEMIGGVAVRVVHGGAAGAFVIGALRPVVYLGEASLLILEVDELAAVVLHEEHHRRTRAPLRAAAVEAWLRIVGRSGAARRLLSARLAELERSADAYAMRHGVRPASIAAALLKVDRHHAAGPAFSGAADHRIAALLDAAAGQPTKRTTPLPYEWLPLVIALAVAVGCHLVELPLPI